MIQPDIKDCEFDSDIMTETLHCSPAAFTYAYLGDVHISEPSYIISQENMVKLFNYIRSLM